MAENTDAKRSELVDREAIAWYSRIHGEPSQQDRYDFERWLAADPAHETAYCLIGTIDMNVVPVGQTLASEDHAVLAGYLDKIDARSRSKRLGSLPSLITVFLIVALSSSWLWLERPNFLQDFSADVVSAVGERRQVILADGSSVLLDADTAIEFMDDASHRGVRLLRGAAYFDVVSQPKPFVVFAADGEVSVLGTRFGVSMRDKGEVTVNLEEGHVSVQSSMLNRHEDLRPGESVRYDHNVMSQVFKVDIGDALAWRQGRYVFENEKLGDVLDHIQRYRGGRIVVLTSSLYDRRISGSLPLDRPDSALQSLKASASFVMNNVGGRVVVVRP